MAETPFERLAYGEAVEILEAIGRDFEFPVKWGADLPSEHERFLAEEHVKRQVVVTDYPKAIKPFYMKCDPEERVALCVDMIAPEGVGEIIGGSQREDDLELLEQRLVAHGLEREVFEWYLDLRRYGTVPHGGFGLGLERLVAWLCGREHVRECIPFPRMLYRIYP